MGFNLTIGQLEWCIDEEGSKCSTVRKVELPEAPADGSPTDHTNKRWPSYSGWGDFCDFMHIAPEYFIPEHPGYKKITKGFKKQVDTLYKKYKGKSDKHDGRLEWLKFWTDWAIANCSEPVLHNT